DLHSFPTRRSSDLYILDTDLFQVSDQQVGRFHGLWLWCCFEVLFLLYFCHWLITDPVSKRITSPSFQPWLCISAANEGSAVPRCKRNCSTESTLHRTAWLIF